MRYTVSTIYLVDLRGDPAMSKIIVVANQKGGVAKTTTAHCTATGLSYKKYKTLAIDLDPQGSLSYL